nr:hypothetical protein Iba_scaffold14943CG0040 [Ipomoea batatas]
MKYNNRICVCLCFSVLEVKTRRRESEKNTKVGDEKPKNMFSRLLKQSGTRITSCICCSVIEDSPTKEEEEVHNSPPFGHKSIELLVNDAKPERL